MRFVEIPLFYDAVVSKNGWMFMDDVDIEKELTEVAVGETSVSLDERKDVSQPRENAKSSKKSNRKKKRRKGSKKKQKKKSFPWLSLIGLIFGLAILAFPVAMDWYSTYKADQIITTLTDETDTTNDPSRLMFLAQAQAYNSNMVGEGYNVDEVGELLPYDDQLSWKGKPYMAYLHVPKASIKMPIYHGTADEELAAGVGHLEGRSLPVGGNTSMCILEGHSGMTTSRMFDDIRMLDEGDMFVIWTLDEPYAYKVTSWEILDPDDVYPSIEFKEGHDECVLITCTTTPDSINPKGRIGINDKRLLVHAERCEYDPDYFVEAAPIQQVVTSPRSYPFLITMLLVILFFVVGALLRRRRRKKRMREKQRAMAAASGNGTDDKPADGSA